MGIGRRKKKQTSRHTGGHPFSFCRLNFISDTSPSLHSWVLSYPRVVSTGYAQCLHDGTRDVAARGRFLLPLLLALFLRISMGIPSGAWLLRHGAPPTPVMFVFPRCHFLPCLKYSLTEVGSGVSCSGSAVELTGLGPPPAEATPADPQYLARKKTNRKTCNVKIPHPSVKASKVPGGSSVPLSSLQQWSFLKPLSFFSLHHPGKEKSGKKKKGLILTIG